MFKGVYHPFSQRRRRLVQWDSSQLLGTNVFACVVVVAGEIDLEMFSQLRLKHPSITVDNHVVEPSSQQMHNYKGIDYLTAYHIPLNPSAMLLLCCALLTC